ncbi:MFS general substrate transporter [Rhizoclosmatium globosum]|uniref:MFS general substrate transporter n=1 Tax=Rhizoclosmatium globosum TaxID=329046 RepID=A0A1Y2C8Q6_9FUNG|nr:MFS general substrate transporter [Rhizoclosmatium globosum]|eukprot:ORY43409.1 MFS general substrate transporter [Rhizoclosmatium globosum]
MSQLETPSLPFRIRPHPNYALAVLLVAGFTAITSQIPFQSLLVLIVCRDLDRERGGTTTVSWTQDLSWEDYKSCAQRSDVQATVASWSLWFNLAEDIPATIFLIVGGYIVDLVGRKKAMCLSIISMMLQSLSYLSLSVVDVPLILLLPVYIISGATGGLGIMFLAGSAYIADTSDPQDRTKYFVLLESVLSVAMCFGPMGGGYIAKEFGFATFYSMTASATLLILGYLVFFFPDSSSQRLPESASKSVKTIFLDCLTSISVTLQMVFSFRAATALVAISTLQAFAATGSGLLILQYPMKQFGFDAFKTGQLIFVSSLQRIFILTLVLPTILSFSKTRGWQKVNVEIFLLRFSFFMMTVAQICYGLARTEEQFFSSTIPNAASSVGSPTMRAMLSTLVSPSFQGRLFSSISLFERVIALAGTMTTNLIYRSTVESFPQALFFVIAGLLAVGFVISLLFISKQGVEAMQAAGETCEEETVTEETPLLA